MHLRGGIDAAARAAAVVIGLTTLVMSIVVGGDVGSYALFAIILAACAVSATLFLGGPAGPAIGLVCAGLTVWILGDELFVPVPRPYPTQALLGENVPTVARYFAWVSAILLVLTTAVGLLVRRGRSRLAVPVSLVAGAVVGAVVLGVGVVPSVALADATHDRLGTPDHTVAGYAPPPAADTSGPTWQNVRWQRDAERDPNNHPGEISMVPGRGLVVQTTHPQGRWGMVRVLDAHTGVERWHDEIDVGALFIDAADGRLLVVHERAAVVFDLDTGRVLDTTKLPDPRPDVAWESLHSPVAETSGTAVVGRTAVLGAGSGATPEKVLAVDLTTLHVTEVDHNPGGCEYGVPEGSPEVVQLLRFKCGQPARLELAGDRLVGTVPLPVQAGNEVTMAHATDKGAVIGFGSIGTSSVDLLLAVVDGRPDPVVRLTAESSERGLDAIVLPATAKDPQRIMLTRGHAGPVIDPATSTVELVDASGARLPTPMGATPIQSSYVRPVFAAGDRVYAPSFVVGQGMKILDAHTLRQLAVVPDPCDPRTRTAVGSVGVVLCQDGRLLGFD